MLPDKRIFKATAHVANERQLAGAMRPAFSYDDLICISVNHEVCVVRHDNNLPPLPSVTEAMCMRPAKSSTQPREARTWCALKFRWTPVLAF